MPKKESESFLDYRLRLMEPMSKTICAAKWYNATIWLGSGRTASCHHPPMHEIDKKAIRKNPKALHNTEKKKEARREMLAGKQTSECDYCWRIENLGPQQISDRVYKTEIYKDEEVRELSQIGANASVNLKTLEIAFDRTCNFACSYCNPTFSTKWGQDISNNGAYKNLVSDGAKAYQQDGKWASPYSKSADNPYMQAFWKWWPELKTSLQELRITGGEPMLSQDFWKVMESLASDWPKQIRLSINSNLGSRRELIDRLANLSHKLEDFDVYTSCEAVGAQAEYIRDGLDFDYFCSNVEYLLEVGNVRVLHMMMTINSLCLFSITDFLDQMLAWKLKYGKRKLLFSTNILRFPSFMSPLSLPEDTREDRRQELLLWLERNRMNDLVSEWERNGLARLVEYLEKQSDPHRRTSTMLSREQDFRSFYEQYDQRRGKNFVDTFPQLAAWYNGIDAVSLDELSAEEISQRANKDGWVLNPEDQNPD